MSYPYVKKSFLAAIFAAIGHRFVARKLKMLTHTGPTQRVRRPETRELFFLSQQ